MKTLRVLFFETFGYTIVLKVTYLVYFQGVYIPRPYKGPSVQHPSIQLLNKARRHTFEEIYKPC